MSASERLQNSDDIQHTLREVQNLLARQKLEEQVVSRQSGPRHELVEGIVHKQNIARMSNRLNALHPADIAYILEALPFKDRLFIWELVQGSHDGDVLLEVSDAVRESLIDAMNNDELVAAAEQLDADELADLLPDLPKGVFEDIYLGLDADEREQLRAAMSYPEDAVGALMDFDMVTVRDDVSLDVVLQYLRQLKDLPDHTDQLFVIDSDGRLIGVLTLQRLLISNLGVQVHEVMEKPVRPMHPDDNADDAARAFERYDLISAPVTNHDGTLVGRVTVAVVLDFIREQSDAELLNQAGLKEEEDIFAPIIDSVQNRWAWLAINLLTAFFASRVIGAFEGSIEKLVVLAALMPIVAGIGGNSGNQTTTMIVRAMAMDQIRPDMLKQLLRKEVGVASLNGLIWGGLLGVIAYWLYDSPALGMVMTAATTLNLLLAATMGVIIPFTMQRFGRDPAIGSSVLITACTDSGGFFIFLGLAALVLIG